MTIIKRSIISYSKLLIVILTTVTLSTRAFGFTDDSLRYEILLTDKMAVRNHISEKFTPNLEITSGHLILLSTTHQFYLLGWGGIMPYAKPVTGVIGSYASTPDSLLMVIRNTELCSFDATGHLSKLFNVPAAGMGIKSGKYVMYLFDRDKSKTRCGLYVLARGGKYARLFEVPGTVNSLAERNNSVFFATKNAVFCYQIRERQVVPVVALPKGQEIQSVTVDSLSGRVYFSTDHAIYTVKESNAVIISTAFCGILRFLDGGLIVFNPEKRYVVSITGIGELVSASRQEKPAPPVAAPPAENTTVKEVQPRTEVPAGEVPVTKAVVEEKTPAKEEVTETNTPPAKATQFPSGILRAERFITNSSGNLEKGKYYVLKKDFTHPSDFVTNFPEGSILKLVGSDPAVIKSWKVIKPSDGSLAVIGSQLYTYFDQAHVWLLKSAP